MEDGIPVSEEGDVSAPEQPPLDAPPDPSPERVVEAPEPQEQSEPGEGTEDAEDASQSDTEDGEEDAT